jgi:hypothetical protein
MAGTSSYERPERSGREGARYYAPIPKACGHLIPSFSSNQSNQGESVFIASARSILVEYPAEIPDGGMK